MRAFSHRLPHPTLNAMCWFCGKRPATNETACQIPMYGNVSRIRLSYKTTRTTWSNTTVRVPRCKACQEAHHKAKWIMNLGLGMSIMLAVAGFAGATVMVDRWGGVWWVVLIAVVLAFIVVPILWTKSLLGKAETRSEGIAHTEFPQVQALIEKGWKVGKRPPQAT